MSDSNRHNEPEAGKVYSLTGTSNEPCIANGNSWSQSVVRCKQCGTDNDLMIAYTNSQLCGDCIRKNTNGN